jgi:hypothetical protein
MAWVALISMLVVTYLIFFHVELHRLQAITEVIQWFYATMASIVCGYNGFATVFDMKNIKGGKCPPKVIDNPDDEDDEENQATKSK